MATSAGRLHPGKFNQGNYFPGKLFNHGVTAPIAVYCYFRFHLWQTNFNQIKSTLHGLVSTWFQHHYSNKQSKVSREFILLILFSFLTSFGAFWGLRYFNVNKSGRFHSGVYQARIIKEKYFDKIGVKILCRGGHSFLKSKLKVKLINFYICFADQTKTSASARRISRHTPSLSPGVLSTGR